MSSGRSPLLGSLTVAFAASLFGMLGPLSRTVYDLGLTPPGFVAWRAGLGALVLGGLVAWRVRRAGVRIIGWRSLDTRGRLSLGLAGLTGATLNLAMFQAFDRAPIALVLLCFYTYPALVAVGSSVLGWERMDRPRLAALAISLAGMVAVVAGAPSWASGGIDPLGVVLALSAAVSQATFVLVSRHGYRTVPADQAMLVILAASAAIGAAIVVASGGGPSIVLPFARPQLLGLLLFTGLFAAAIPSLLFLVGIRWIGPVRAGILMLVEPLVGVALAAILLSEPLGPVQAAGGLAILAAAIIVQRSRPAESVIVPAAEPDAETDAGPDPDPPTGPATDSGPGHEASARVAADR